jgi:serine protease Do
MNSRDLSARFKHVLQKNTLASVLLLLGSIYLLEACNSGEAPLEAASALPSASPGASPLVQGGAAVSYADVVNRVAPAVVTVRSTRRVRAPQQHPFFDDPLLREFFGEGSSSPPRGALQRGLGSGVIVTQDGYVLTNHHVIDGAEEIKVELTNSRVYDAKIIGSDPRSDLAVLKLNASALPLLTLGDSDRVRVGDVALAVGNPLGVGQTVTAGIISAKGRTTGLSDGSFESFLQTDAPINQGNSGGALVNTAGELIGINSQILSPTGGNIGIGFAIPANMARSVSDQLIKSGRVRRGQLGVTIQPVTADIAASLGLSEVRGVIISGVEPGSPAERAGIKSGDVITAFNGTRVEDSNSLRNQIASTAPDTEVTLTLWRDGREQQVRATLGELSSDTPPRNTPGGGNTPGGTGRFGLSVTPLTPQIAGQLGLPNNTQGLVISAVDPTSPAAEAGLRTGDVIEQVNRQPVRTAEEFQAAVERAGDRPALLLVNRRGNRIFVTLRRA